MIWCTPDRMGHPIWSNNTVMTTPAKGPLSLEPIDKGPGRDLNCLLKAGQMYYKRLPIEQ